MPWELKTGKPHESHEAQVGTTHCHACCSDAWLSAAPAHGIATCQACCKMYSPCVFWGRSGLPVATTASQQLTSCCSPP